MRTFLSVLFGLCGLASAQKIKVDALYGQYCSGCHGAKFEGGNGGSLVDGEWKHGGSDAEIYKSIAKGNPELGMTPWEGVLTDDQIRGLVIFLRENEKKTLAKGMDFPTPSPDKVTKTELEELSDRDLGGQGTEKSVGDRLPSRRSQTRHGEIRATAASSPPTANSIPPSSRELPRSSSTARAA